jgi:hypothetical protein
MLLLIEGGRRRFAHVEMAGQPIQLRVPEVISLSEPVVRSSQTRRLELTPLHSAFFHRTYEPCLFEHAQVLEHGGHGHIQRPRQFADRRFAAGEPR